MKRTTTIPIISAMLLFASILAVGNNIAFSFGGILDTYFAKNNVDYNSEPVQNALAEGKALAQEVALNGDVLLKNTNNTLPLAQDSLAVNIFGWGGSDNGFLYQGGGSSEGGYSADKISLYDAFRQNGFVINEDLANAYNGLSYRREGSPDQNQHSIYYRTYEPGEDFYDRNLADAVNFSDTAIVVLSRRATEGDDLPKVSYDENGNADTSRNYLSLTAKEELMLDKVTNNFSKVIVIINSSAPMEMGFLDNPKIQAAMYIGYPGYYGATAVPQLLKGDFSPSGHLTDTAAYELESAPSYVNSGPDGSKTYQGAGAGRYKDYAENIYVGYKWYETADEEGYFDNEIREAYGETKKGYDAVVQYPFGYGLSYTTFEWTTNMNGMTDEDGNPYYPIVNQDGKEIKNMSQLTLTDTLTFNIWVENTGTMAGKDVVGLYMNAPYTPGGIEKASQVLVGFAKTESLDPGIGQMLSIDVKVTDLASYDTYDSNNNGFMGYELDGGNYTFSFRTDAHTVKNNEIGHPIETILTVPSDGYRVEEDPVTGTTIENLFTNYTNEKTGATSTVQETLVKYPLSMDGHDESADYDQNITYLSRSDFKGTYPVETPIRTASQSFYTNVFLVNSPKNNPEDTMPKFNQQGNLTLLDVKGLPYDDPKWDQLISQLSLDELGNLSANGGFHTIAIPDIKKDQANDSDGGTGFTSGVQSADGIHATKYTAANITASTWDWKEAYKWGRAVGKEGQALGLEGWYAPGCNVHRSPLGGRNFEYFSEDGFMCGKMVAQVVKGCTENGVYAYMKHFALNDTDEGRNGQFIWATEQSLREIWAKPGELATKEGGANAMMASVDRIGATRATGSYALLTRLLRDEWGFRGSVITDYYQGGQVNDLDEGIRAGNDLALMPGGSPHNYIEDFSNPSATTVRALQNAAHNILFTYIDTIHRTETAQDIDLSETLGTKGTNNSGKWWRYALIAVDSVVGVAIVVSSGIMIYLTWFKKREEKYNDEISN